VPEMIEQANGRLLALLTKEIVCHPLSVNPDKGVLDQLKLNDVFSSMKVLVYNFTI